jgi:hypothetical protein
MVDKKTSKAFRDPTAFDDSGAGYKKGDTWINQATGKRFILIDPASGAARWALDMAHAPSNNDDNSKGYAVGDLWHDRNTGKVWQLMENGAGNAVWEVIEADKPIVVQDNVPEAKDFKQGIDLIIHKPTGDLYTKNGLGEVVKIPKDELEVKKVNGVPVPADFTPGVDIVLDKLNGDLYVMDKDGNVKRVGIDQAAINDLIAKINDAKKAADDAKATADNAKATADDAKATADANKTKLNNLKLGDLIDTDTTGAANGDVLTYDGAKWVKATPAAGGQPVADATETQKGIIQIATQAEVDAGTDNTKAITSKGLKNAQLGSITKHSDVDTTTNPPEENSSLKFKNGKWVPEPPQWEEQFYYIENSDTSGYYDRQQTATEQAFSNVPIFEVGSPVITKKNNIITDEVIEVTDDKTITFKFDCIATLVCRTYYFIANNNEKYINFQTYFNAGKYRTICAINGSYAIKEVKFDGTIVGVFKAGDTLTVSRGTDNAEKAVRGHTSYDKISIKARRIA